MRRVSIFGVPLPILSMALGGFEMLLGVLCLGATSSAFFLFVCAWKLGTEGLYVPAQAYGAWWEVLERGSSYAAPLLWIGFQQVVTAHGGPALGLFPRLWLLTRGSVARHADGRPRHKMPPHIWTADVLDLSMRQITPLARSSMVCASCCGRHSITQMVMNSIYYLLDRINYLLRKSENKR